MTIESIKFQRDGRRETILSIAREVFTEEGYAASSMSTIAARLGGSKGTLYNYFKSKADLFIAVIQHQCDINEAELFEISDKDPRTYLTQWSRRVAQLMLSEDVISIHRIVVAEAVRFPEIGQALYEAGPKRGTARLVDYFEQAIAEGRLKPCDPVRAAEQAMELTLAGFYRRRLWNVGPPPTDAEIDATVQAGVDTFLKAFGV
jgi:AcrR family transcriptional regulator